MKTLLIFILTAAVLFNYCGTTEPPPPPDDKKPTITLALEDVSCTEAWLQLTTKDLNLPAQLTLKQYNPTGDSVTQIFSLSTQDSLLYIDSLLPNQTYNFQLSCIWNPASGIKHQVSSNKLPVITMDTTSHNFTWQSWEFGLHSSSILYDVAIIDENNIWAVGAIYMNDSLGNPDPHAYNAVHWNGSNWELVRILVRDYGTITGYLPIKSIYAFTENNIWFASYADLIKWDGNSFKSKAFFMTIIPFYGQVNKMWGIDESNIYCVGNTGSIYNYVGTTWTKIESGTTLNIFDIWGSIKAEYHKILCAAGSFSQVQEKILRINKNQSIDTIPWLNGIRINSVWFSGRYKTFACGDGIWIGDENYNWVRQQFGSNSFVNKIRGNANNDVFAVGAFGMATHFNGVSWQVLPPISIGASLFSLSTKNRIVAVVGTKNSKAFIAIGLN